MEETREISCWKYSKNPVQPHHLTWDLPLESGREEYTSIQIIYWEMEFHNPITVLYHVWVSKYKMNKSILNQILHRHLININITTWTLNFRARLKYFKSIILRIDHSFQMQWRLQLPLSIINLIHQSSWEINQLVSKVNLSCQSTGVV